MRRTWKQPGEARWFTYDFTELLAGRTIQSFTTATSAGRDDPTDQLTQVGAPIVSDAVVQIEWGGGLDGETYATTVKVRDSQNEDQELEGEILVAEVEFVLPQNISSAYLTGEQYVARFGFEETVRVTDQDRKGTIDGTRLQAAIDDATELVTSYLGVRYTLPLNPVPPLVRGMVADLARERLHAQRPMPAITQAADRARTQLRDLSAGRMALPDQTGAEAEMATAGWARSGGVIEGTVFNLDTLDRF
jgi:phage gp36-like protein